ncbi:3-deoxy-7-phosphoheptulonate synthase [Actinokineospora enzanensis]|uniref:3-deoxy-7-phosphoheptulonate synthase n=1 Tax=Actinokineospora enzanensis TaxID=155975 RepID=UPI000526128E|nr:3-deoxy-7-phosphoheptulonate synthase [Actinokineospora enzanensis]
MTAPAHRIGLLPADQQPQWPDRGQVELARAALMARQALVSEVDVLALRARLAAVAAGDALVVQAGDCAEDPAECAPDDVSRKAGMLDVLGGVLRMATGLPVLRVGRIAGQYAKPRSSAVEPVDGRELPVYRGHLVNDPRPEESARVPDPSRLLHCHRSASRIVAELGWTGTHPGHVPQSQVWTSHEALLLDYEVPQLRRVTDGWLLGSTHWPWLGARTRKLDGAHVALLAQVVNPVSCKVGPDLTAGALVELCDRLDPSREPGRLTLISRLGADLVRDRLPGLVAAVHAAGHPVIWLCDPMHGNTFTGPDGRKRRLVDRVVHEVRGFRAAVAEVGGVAGGLHLETTPDPVRECLSRVDDPGDPYTSLCDPRLNLDQAMTVVSAWRA